MRPWSIIWGTNTHIHTDRLQTGKGEVFEIAMKEEKMFQPPTLMIISKVNTPVKT